MSIKTLDFKSYNQDLTVNPENKLLYGEIFTPFSLIEKMFESNIRLYFPIFYIFQ